MVEAAPGVVSVTRNIGARSDTIFELIADPAQQPKWDGNDNLRQAESGQRILGVGDIFIMLLTTGGVRENHVIEFEEGRRIAWTPAEPGSPPPGHLWRWELDPTAEGMLVTHTYDWSQLTDPQREARARATTSQQLAASLDRLALLAEHA